MVYYIHAKTLQLVFVSLDAGMQRGQWTIVLLSLILAITTISSIQFITQRIQQGLSEQSAKLLGGDLVISSSLPIPAVWASKARDEQLETASIIDMQTMVNFRGKLVLVNLQAVSKDYPLLSNKLSMLPKQALVDRQLLSSLSVTLPAKLKIGAARFQATTLLPDDLEISYTGWLIAPRMLIRLDDLAATKILVPGSRANYRLLITGTPANLKAFRAYIEPLFNQQQRIMDSEQQRYSLINHFSQVERYIELTVIFCLFMCGVAISLSVRQYVRRHHQAIALWRCLGATTPQIKNIYLIQLTLAAVVSSVIGTILGYFIHLKLMHTLSSYFSFSFPPPNWQPYLQGFLTSIVILFCFAFPIIQKLIHVNPLELWKDEIDNTPQHSTYAILALFIFIFFTCWLMHFTLFLLFIIASILVFIAIGLFITDGLFKLIRYCLPATRGAIRRGLSQLIQFPESSGIQMGAFSMVLMLMLILQFMKHDLLDKWQDAMLQQAPNYFAFNLTGDDLPFVTEMLTKNQAHTTHFFPMVKGRLVTLNRQPVLSVARSGNHHNALHRDLNLSSSLTYPSDNRVISGKIWGSDDIGKPLVSVESSLASALNLHIGDELGFLIDGKEIRTTVSNIRTVNWASFNPNFYIIFPPKSLAQMPSTYIISFYLPIDKTAILAKMSEKIPNMTIVDMADTLTKIQRWIQQATTATQGLFVFSLVASILIFIAALVTTMDERKRTYHLIYMLGGGKSYVMKSIIVEMAAIFTITFIFSYCISSIISYTLINIIY